jgi:two-component system chemotaxis sensor kinase CheA
MGQRVMNLRGSVMPLLPLSAMCRTGYEDASIGDDAFVVVVQAGDKPVAVSVDALMEQQEIVVKSLGGQVAQTKGIAGASILGDGQVVLILDVPVLIKAAMQREALALAS